jgi:chitin synthase
MNRHPPSNYGDEPPAYLDHETASFLSDHESPTNASRGATMRLLPTSGDGADHTPYVLTAFLSIHP